MQALLYLMALISLAELIIIIVQTIRLKLRDSRLRGLESNLELIASQRAKELAQREVERAREDAAKRSAAVTAGKIYEQLAPLLPSFKYNPKDARFLGSPIDFIVFDGLSDGRDVTIRLIEVKTGESKLSDRESKVKNAVERCRVSFEVLRIDDRR